MNAAQIAAIDKFIATEEMVQIDYDEERGTIGFEWVDDGTFQIWYGDEAYCIVNGEEVTVNGFKDVLKAFKAWQA